MKNLSISIERKDLKVHFEGISESNPDSPIQFDFGPPVGDGKGFSGLETLLMSFAGCVSTTIVFLLGRSGKHVSTYKANIEGIRCETPLSLKEIDMKIYIKSDDITVDDMNEVIKRAKVVSPVCQAIKNNVIVEINYELVK
jgi:putative redox protein